MKFQIKPLLFDLSWKIHSNHDLFWVWALRAKN
jgi:hypothetical protein